MGLLDSITGSMGSSGSSAVPTEGADTAATTEGASANPMAAMGGEDMSGLLGVLNPVGMLAREVLGDDNPISMLLAPEQIMAGKMGEGSSSVTSDTAAADDNSDTMPGATSIAGAATTENSMSYSASAAGAGASTSLSL